MDTIILPPMKSEERAVFAGIILAEKGETVKRVLDSDSQEYFIEVEKSDENEHGQITHNNTDNKKT